MSSLLLSVLVSFIDRQAWKRYMICWFFRVSKYGFRHGHCSTTSCSIPHEHAKVTTRQHQILREFFFLVGSLSCGAVTWLMTAKYLFTCLIVLGLGTSLDALCFFMFFFGVAGFCFGFAQCFFVGERPPARTYARKSG